MSELSILLSPAIRGIGTLGAGLSQNRLSQAAAARVRAIGEADARLRRLQGSQLLAAQRVARVKQRVSGPTVTDVAITTAELEAEDVERFRFAAEAQADQTERQGRASLFASTLGLSTIFLDAVQARKEEEQNRELRALVETAIGTGRRRLT